MMILRMSPRLVTATAAMANASSTKNAECVKFIWSRASPNRYNVATPLLCVDWRSGGNLQSSLDPTHSSARNPCSRSGVRFQADHEKREIHGNGPSRSPRQQASQIYGYRGSGRKLGLRYAGLWPVIGMPFLMLKEIEFRKFCLDLKRNRPVIRFVILVPLASIGALFFLISHWAMKAERLGAPIISSRTKHLIGLLLIFAGLAIFMS